MLLDSNTGGGGQANRPDWAGCSNNWWTIAHELGHQFGLDHLRSLYSRSWAE
ncbi:MAG: reprolysin-like metallopeptidase [Fimbriimonadales bacterium]